jgi:hypothetical protein
VFDRPARGAFAHFDRYTSSTVSPIESELSFMQVQWSQ